MIKNFLAITTLVIFVIFNCLSVNSEAKSNEKVPETFNNPIIPGFHPDPSLCRVGDDYYLVNSSFEWFPGIPIFHSKDLVNWEQIGNVLDRPSQLAMKEGLTPSSGLWAPTIRYHNGMFYVIVTCMQCGGNLYVTAKDPRGPWSDPIFLNTPGIDPELFFDDDGKVYYVGSSQGKWGPPRRWQWEDRIYIQEYDLKTNQLLGEKYHLTSGHANNAKWCEGPHIYKIKGKYLLLTGEGGTWENHCVTAHLSDSLFKPFEAIQQNPVLTHRNLGAGMDITTVGHCDMVQTQNGDWWSVMLGVRPIGDNFRTLGRETFMTPVKFEGTTPVFNPGIGRVLMTDKRPNLPWSPVAIVPKLDNFDSTKLGFQWCFLRTPFENWWNISKGTLSINLRPQTAEQLDNPSLIARRQEHHSFDASAMMKFTPTAENEEAGLIAMQNDKYQFRIVLTIKDGVKCIQLIKLGCESRDKRNEICKEIVASAPYSKADVVLGIRANKLDYEFLYGETAKTLKPLGGIQDGRLLSSNWAGGFIGVFVGMYASSNGQPSTNKANYDWFEYSGR